MSDRQNLAFSLWLLLVCLLIFSMVCLGGVTRLTGSGLSMVEWAPVTGLLPPLSEQQWIAVFDLYRATPEYLKVNFDMDLSGFKSIFWFEYLHRILGRLIGIVFFVPMLYFQLRYPLETGLRWKLIGLFLLGGAQGLLGWYMVKSGLVNDPHVSQYRLVAHLALALLLYVLILWMGSGFFVRNWQQRYPLATGFIWLAWGTLMLVFVTIMAGGFVAGTHAGYAFNTFPLMNGQLVPEGYTALSPAWKNLFENVATVQFNHRLLATFTLLSTALLAWLASRLPLLTAIKRTAYLSVLLVLLQYSLGVLTLLNHVPVSLAATHQAVAVLVLTASVFLLRSLLWANRS